MPGGETQAFFSPGLGSHRAGAVPAWVPAPWGSVVSGSRAQAAGGFPKQFRGRRQGQGRSGGGFHRARQSEGLAPPEAKGAPTHLGWCRAQSQSSVHFLFPSFQEQNEGLSNGSEQDWERLFSKVLVVESRGRDRPT